MQKARLARIRIAKASSGAAFVSKKKAAEARLAAQESGIELDDTYREEDIFELQHHHLLRCLEKTTASGSAGIAFVQTFIFIVATLLGSGIRRTRNAVQWPTEAPWFTITTCQSNALQQQHHGPASIVLWTMLLTTLSGMFVVNAQLCHFNTHFIRLPTFTFIYYFQ